MFAAINRHPAYRRYLRRMAGSAVLYIAAIMLAVRVLHHHAALGPLTVGVALLPGLAVLGMIWGFARLLLELDDEFLRMLEIRKALVATGLTLAVASVWGLLEIFTDVSRLDVFWIFPIWAMGLVVGGIVNKLTVGVGGCA